MSARDAVKLAPVPQDAEPATREPPMVGVGIAFCTARGGEGTYACGVNFPCGAEVIPCFGHLGMNFFGNSNISAQTMVLVATPIFVPKAG